MAADKNIETQQRDTSKEDESEDGGPDVEHVTDKDREKDLSTEFDDTIEPTDAPKDKDVEAQQGVDPQHPNVMAGEDYSAFTVPQKRAIIVAGSFLAWFSPVSNMCCWCTHRD